MGKIKVKANHPIYNSQGIKGIPRLIGSGEVLNVDENVIKAFGKKAFTIVEGKKKTKDVAGSEKEKKVKAMTTKG